MKTSLFWTGFGLFICGSFAFAAGPTWQKVTPGGTMNCSKYVSDSIRVVIPQNMTIKYSVTGGGGGGGGAAMNSASYTGGNGGRGGDSVILVNGVIKATGAGGNGGIGSTTAGVKGTIGSDGTTSSGTLSLNTGDVLTAVSGGGGGGGGSGVYAATHCSPGTGTVGGRGGSYHLSNGPANGGGVNCSSGGGAGGIMGGGGGGAGAHGWQGYGNGYKGGKGGIGGIGASSMILAEDGIPMASYWSGGSAGSNDGTGLGGGTDNYNGDGGSGGSVAISYVASTCFMN